MADDIDRLRTQVDASILRTALVAIQELHNSWISDDGAKEEMFCTHCRQADWHEWDYVPFPCATRKLADEGLADRMARTNQGGA